MTVEFPSDTNLSHFLDVVFGPQEWDRFCEVLDDGSGTVRIDSEAPFEVRQAAFDLGATVISEEE